MQIVPRVKFQKTDKGEFLLSNKKILMIIKYYHEYFLLQGENYEKRKKYIR